jgi:hypothetical protein
MPSSSTPSRLTIAGYPKCGTSALIREIKKDPRTALVTNPDGSLELAWPRIKEIEDGNEPVAELVVHKFTAYIYNMRAVDYLADDLTRRFVLCIRDPLKAVVSWYLMHQRIAKDGKQTNHFAFKNRDFYANCTVDEYFEAFAKERTDYAANLEKLVRRAGLRRVLVVSQERMAADTAAVGAACVRFGLGDPDALEIPESSADASGGHVSRAEKEKLEMSQATIDVLTERRERLYQKLSRPEFLALV